MTIEELKQALEAATPGPWYVGIDDDGNPLSGRPGVSAAEKYDCDIVHWDGFVQEYWRSARGDREIHANAHLIANAPIWLAELVKVAEAAQAFTGAQCMEDRHGSYHALREALEELNDD